MATSEQPSFHGNPREFELNQKRAFLNHNFQQTLRDENDYYQNNYIGRFMRHKRSQSHATKKKKK